MSYLTQDLVPEQLNKITQAQEYLKRHKISELFDELLAKVLIERPENLREFLKEEIIKIKANNKSTFFSYKDFDAMFESWNLLGTGSIPFESLILTLDKFGINTTKQILVEKYPKLNGKVEIGKADFIDVIGTEYNEKVCRPKNL